MLGVLCVIQARTGSTRLPAKVLADVGGRPLLGLMLDRLTPPPADRLVVATSDNPRDQPVANIAGDRGIEVVRGPEADVLQRFLGALEAHPAEHVVRLTADCPLSDPELIRAIVQRHIEAQADYTSNVIPRTFPKGLDVEVIRASALRVAAAEATDPAEREHVTPFLYRHPERFRLANLRHDQPLGEERWTVDTPADLEFVREVMGLLGQRWDARWQEVLGMVGRRVTPAPGSLVLRPAFEGDAARLRAWRNDPDAVANSVNPRTVGEEEHSAWLRRLLDDPAHRLWIGELEAEAVGQVRIDVRAATAEVSIAVAPELRGQGHGARLLQALMDVLADDFQVQHLVARARPTNTVSLRVFARAGFAVTGEHEGFVLMGRTC